MAEQWRVGIGYDVHRIVPERPLMLGGVEVAAEFGLGGNTDGDVVLHAIIDALFGAAALPDIGDHFPPGSTRASSTELMTEAMNEIRSLGWVVGNVDVTIVAERPRLTGVKQDIRQSVAGQLSIPAERVSIKAKTNEGLDALGGGLAIACHAGLTLTRKE